MQVHVAEPLLAMVGMYALFVLSSPFPLQRVSQGYETS